MLMIGDIHPLPADIALAAKIVLVPFHLDDTVVFDFYLQPAVLGAKDTACFVDRSHNSSCFHLTYQ